MDRDHDSRGDAVGDLLFVLVHYGFQVFFGLVAMGTVVAMVAVVFVPWRRRSSRVDR